VSELPAQDKAQSGRRALPRGVLIALLLIVPPVLLVVALGIVLTKLPTTTPDPNNPNPPPDEALLAAIRSKHSDAARKFSELEAAYGKLDSDFRAVLGFTLEDSGSKDKYSNHFLDVLTGPDPPIRAWTSLRNAAIPAREFNEKREVLRTVETRLQELRVTLKDKYDAEDVDKWADQKQAALSGQADNVRELQDRLAPVNKKETP
jgi:hypothetical protein